MIVDLFAGGGGASVALEAATGEAVDVAINHSEVALAVHRANHSATRHLVTDVFAAAPREVVGRRKVEVLWASPDCTDHSNAKGGVPDRSEGKDTRYLAWVVRDWARDVRPRTIFMENVAEFEKWGPLIEVQIKHGPRAGEWVWARDPERIGETFRQFVGSLELLGYRVEWRVLDASQFGAPTKRRRLFIVARCDGLPITWPDPTHGPGLLPLRTAAECIDWNIPCPSIFTRKRPLAEKTLWRIAQGLKRFVLDNPRPFIVKVNHGRWEPRHESIDEPLSTVTASRRGHALVAPTLQHSGNGERPTQAARVYDLHQPLSTVMATGQKHALVAAYLAKHFGDPLRRTGGGVVVGQDLGQPLGTVTSRDHHSLAAVTLAHYRGTDESHPGCWDVEQPLPTVTASGIHVAEVRAFITAYYSADRAPGHGQPLTAPMRTLTTRARLGLVLVEGVAHQIVDIGLRMLRPHELLRAQFGEHAEGYDLSAAKTQEDQVMLIGNSVSPPPAIALLRANLPAKLRRVA